jgi:hypothetical protein
MMPGGFGRQVPAAAGLGTLVIGTVILRVQRHRCSPLWQSAILNSDLNPDLNAILWGGLPSPAGACPEQLPSFRGHDRALRER